MNYFKVIPRMKVADWWAGRYETVERARTLHEIPAPDSKDGTAITLVWGAEPENGASVSAVVTSNGGKRDFLGWASTFLPHARPLTARCRVLDHGELQRLSLEWECFEGRWFRQLGVGLMLGELLSHDVTARKGRREVLPAVNLHSGLSFACLRETSLKTGARREDIMERWVAARRGTRQRERILGPRSVLAASNVIASLVGRGQETDLSATEAAIVETCRARRDGRRLGVGRTSIVGSAEIRPEQTREERLAKFEEAVARLGHQGTGDPELDAFAVGFWANETDPGSLTYTDFVVSQLRRWPSAMLWYGLSAGLTTDSGVLSELAGAGDRAWREVSRPDSLLAAPTTDLSWDELEIFLSSDMPTEDYPLQHSSVASVELSPGLWTTISLVGRRAAEAEPVSAARESRQYDLERELGFLLNRAQDVLGQLSRGRNSQGKLPFDDQPGRRGKGRK